MNTTDMRIYIAQETKKRIFNFWGGKYTFTPKLASSKLGDGKQLVYYSTTLQRPYWWLVRIDSGMKVEDVTDDILDLLMSDFGTYPEKYWLTKEEFDKERKDKNSELHGVRSFKKYLEMCRYPSVYPECGRSYGVIVNLGECN